MKKDFKQELTELINKHGLEKEMRDTPDFILAQVCIDAMTESLNIPYERKRKTAPRQKYALKPFHGIEIM